MTAPRNQPPANVWETLRRLLLCNKKELAARLEVSARTLATWEAETEAGGSAGKRANAAAANLLQQILKEARSDVHAQLLLNWDAIDRIGGKR